MSDPYIGEIRMFGGNFAPVGWLFCQGQLVAISDYGSLFNLIGTTYGGDGQTNFALPNLQSRFPVHQGAGYVVGQAGGVEEVTLTTNQLPVHSHQVRASSQAGSSNSPAGNVWAAMDRNAYSSAGPNTTMTPNALSAAGGNQPHDNMAPYLVLNFILATEGIYPPPN